tara:strand:- start:86 stop:214 length:129 start_codon:yes stop_codon:yes gene_type:complete
VIGLKKDAAVIDATGVESCKYLLQCSRRNMRIKAAEHSQHCS